ncbi:hypothetical protein PHYSODRAFT_502755 [Phytophthora sojae]|uniref:Uncharacterized protein n=1 Tax=Phytophthora sojae (strain P6497) TaxID=1094619 RepID=G4ZFC7_PHYSP|nr:hypothetical protein PHYSODRAFT_502755 [Phytophthora sojae]EGZ17016.1 hypothetical protein PHYSODRAFT_502755 [Phytophthora sojae]|eukprot:XP_009526074.1 hypothetical protein PHYSODRAFT_502755 [Phytophthora sojae]
MIFLRKLLSTGNRSHQQFAVDMWCTWLNHRLPFSEQQEEEIVSALKNSMTACHDIQAWSFGRLEQIFQSHGKSFIGSYPKRLANEYDDEDSGLQRFRFDSLDSFYQQNSGVDGAASIGLIFQKVLSCLIGFEKAATRSKVSSEGVPIEGLGEKDGDIKQWLVDLASNWKYFFHWICQDSNDLLNQSAQGRACGKSAWWKLIARIYIGCAVCNVAIEMLMQQQGISVWSLMEVEFSLHRMIQKLAAQYTNEMETSLSKEHVKAVTFGLHRVLQPEKLQILTAIKSTLLESAGANVPAVDRPSGMSFDAVLFTLDSCCSTLGDEGVYGSCLSRGSNAGGLSEAGSILEVLLSVFLNVRDRVLTAPDLANDNQDDQSTCRSQFSVFADSISVKLPVSARHLVAPAKTAKAVVLLDAKSGEEMLEHVCAAIGRTLEMMMKSTSTSSCNFVRLSHYFLGDVKKCVQLDGFTKLGNAVSSRWCALSSLAFDILCDNVVYNPRLLRLLLSICLPTHLALRVDTFKKRDRKGTSVRRKRLRQGFDARSPYGLKVDSDSDSSASHSSDSDDSVRSNDSNRIPHLQSQASQSIAILAVLTVLEQSQSTLLSAITAKSSAREICTVLHHQEILSYVRIHELVNQALCDSRDFSWGTRKVLLKVLHMIELGLRIGKASGALRRVSGLDADLPPDTVICIYESSVMSALKSRTWVDGIKDASQDSGTKTKVRFVAFGGVAALKLSRLIVCFRCLNPGVCNFTQDGYIFPASSGDRAVMAEGGTQDPV